MKGSRVRRSDQARGAKEPDLVIEGCPCWLELQDASAAEYNPLRKLQQAETDVVESGSSLWPVSVCHQIKRQSIEACLRVKTFLALGDLELPDSMPGFYGQVPMIIDFERLKELLRDDYSRR